MISTLEIVTKADTEYIEDGKNFRTPMKAIRKNCHDDRGRKTINAHFVPSKKIPRKLQVYHMEISSPFSSLRANGINSDDFKTERMVKLEIYKEDSQENDVSDVIRSMG